VVYPSPLIRLSQSVADENAADLELRAWVCPAARVLGALSLVVAVLSGSDSDAEQPTA